MKLLKMKIFRTINGGHTHFEYPDDYDPKKITFGPIYEIELIHRIDNYCYIILGVNDIDYDQFKNANTATKIAKHVFETSDLTKEEAIILGDPWVKQVDHITDEQLVISLCTKIVSKEQLSIDELNKLNPTSSEMGINKSKSFADYLNLAMAK